MTRADHQQHRQHVLSVVYSLVKAGWKIPSYQQAVTHLNAKQIRTARGNPWTRKRLFRFLQNAGYSGLWGVSNENKAPAIVSK